MKKLLLIVTSLVLLVNVYAETDEERIKAMIWKHNDPDFKVTKCDEKWKNESAVILCKKYEYHVQKEPILNFIHENIYTHTRIILLDKAAVNEYSTFKFDVSKNLGGYKGWWEKYNIFVGLKVVKPNGKEYEVTIDKALIDEIRSGARKKEIQKIAVPGLEQGDILDYYYASEDKSVQQAYYIFSPVLYPLASEYPIMKHKVEMHIMRKCYLNARSMNGAPQLSFQDDSKRKDMVYTITDVNRDKAKEQLWAYPLRDIPILAFQAYFVNNSYVKNRLCFYDDTKVIKNNISNDEILEFYNNSIKPYIPYDVKKIVKYLKKAHKKETNPQTIAREAYNYYRQYKNAPLYKFDIIDDPYYSSKPPSDFDFAVTMSKVLTKRKIKHDLVITVPRSIGGIDDMIMVNQMDFLIRVKDKEPFFLSNFSHYSLSTELDPTLEGTEAKAIDVLSDKPKVSNITIPVTKYTENTEVTNLAVSFNAEEAEKLLITETVTSKGLEKWGTNYSMITPGEYINAISQNPYKTEIIPFRFKKQDQKLTEVLNDYDKRREEHLSDLLKHRFDVQDVKINKIELNQPGMWDKTPELIYTSEFQIEKYISKAGNNIILEAGKLIGSQIVPEASDSVRKYNIYMPYARAYENLISISIPKGYTVKGIDKLTSSVTNETGGFTSSAKIEGDKLIIKTLKYFAGNYFPKDSWPKILAYLDAANDFRNKKIMFVAD